MLCEDKARQGIKKYLQHLDDQMVEEWLKEQKPEATVCVDRPPHKPHFDPPSGRPDGGEYVLFVPPEDPLDLEGAQLSKFFRGDDRNEGHLGGSYQGRVSGYDLTREQWMVRPLILSTKLPFLSSSASRVRNFSCLDCLVVPPKFRFLFHCPDRVRRPGPRDHVL